MVWYLERGPADSEIGTEADFGQPGYAADAAAAAATAAAV